MQRKILALFAVVFTWLVSTGGAHASLDAKRFDVSVKEADASLHDSWFGLYAHDKKIGFFHEAIDKVAVEGETFYRKRLRM